LTVVKRLDGESLDLVAQSLNLASELGSLVRGDAGSDDGAADTTGTAEKSLAGDPDVRDALVFCQKRDMQDNGLWLSIGSEDGDFAGTTVEGLGDWSRCQLGVQRWDIHIRVVGSDRWREGLTLVGTLLSLAELSGRLDEVEDLLGESGIGQRPG
jgi:hypothetical protein